MNWINNNYFEVVDFHRRPKLVPFQMNGQLRKEGG